MNPTLQSTLSRRIVRTYLRIARCPSNIRIEVEPGNSPPRIEGRGGYHTTMSGKTEVRHPNAYGYRTLYHKSTRKVVVGRGWLGQLVWSACPAGEEVTLSEPLSLELLANLSDRLGLNAEDTEYLHTHSGHLQCWKDPEVADKVLGCTGWVLWFERSATAVSVTNGDPVHHEGVNSLEEAMAAAKSA